MLAWLPDKRSQALYVRVYHRTRWMKCVFHRGACTYRTLEMQLIHKEYDTENQIDEET